MRASVIGSGSFGTALANVLAVNCEQVPLGPRRRARRRDQRPPREPDLPAGHPALPERPRHHDLEEALEGAELVVLGHAVATPRAR